jgi:hypothetical protein
VFTQDRITAQSPNFLDENLIPTNFSKTQNGNLLIVGKAITDGEQKGQVALLRTSETGAFVWNDAKVFGDSSGNSTGKQAVEQADGTILTIGTFQFSTNKMIGVIKTNANGELQ